jgi:hypothetical protein
MEKFIALKETSKGKRRQCNKAACTGCHQKQERLKPGISKETDNNTVNILQLYYAALIQYHSFPVSNGNQDASYLQCT